MKSNFICVDIFLMLGTRFVAIKKIVLEIKNNNKQIGIGILYIVLYMSYSNQNVRLVE